VLAVGCATSNVVWPEYLSNSGVAMVGHQIVARADIGVSSQ